MPSTVSLRGGFLAPPALCGGYPAVVLFLLSGQSRISSPAGPAQRRQPA